jgi:curved DNA-binding protein CbpA
MNIKRCLEILELESVSSLAELKRAYRDLVQIWHPDRFHGNSRLEQNAGKKLKEITLAYEHLLAYFDPDQSKRLRTSSSDAKNEALRLGPDRRAAFQRNVQGHDISSRIDETRAARTSQSPDVRVYPARRPSPARKIFRYGFFCIFLVVAGIIVYVSLNMDISVLELKEPSSFVLEKLNIGEKKEEIQQKPNPSLQPSKQNQGQEIKPLQTDSYYEIYLDSGNSILTESWWEEGDMIIYKKYSGSMGIEKKRVKKIIKR